MSKTRSKLKPPPKTKVKRVVKVPPAPNPNYYHVYRVNRTKTIFWQLNHHYLSEHEAELEAGLLDSRAVINRKSYFYIVLDGPSALHLWQGYDVRVGTEKFSQAKTKTKANQSKKYPPV